MKIARQQDEVSITYHTEILRKNSRTDSVLKGSKICGVTVEGNDPLHLVIAVTAAHTKFQEVFGHEPDPDITRFLGFTTTFQTVFEIAEGPE